MIVVDETGFFVHLAADHEIVIAHALRIQKVVALQTSGVVVALLLRADTAEDRRIEARIGVLNPRAANAVAIQAATIHKRELFL